MRSTLQSFLPELKRHEGGYVNHPRDPGGCTNMGITLATLRRYVPGATCSSVRNLDWSMAARIYRDGYWNAVRGDDLPVGVDAVVFDHAVNAGPSRAVKLFQKAIGADVDGVIGILDLNRAARMDPAKLVVALSKARLGYYERLRNWRTFGRGWTRRVNETREWALDWIDRHPKGAQ